MVRPLVSPVNRLYQAVLQKDSIREIFRRYVKQDTKYACKAGRRQSVDKPRHRLGAAFNRFTLGYDATSRSRASCSATTDGGKFTFWDC